MVKKEINIIIDIDDDGIIQDYDIITDDSVRLKDPEIQRLCTERKVSKCPHCKKELELILHLAGMSGSLEYLEEPNEGTPMEMEDAEEYKMEAESDMVIKVEEVNNFVMVETNDGREEYVQVVVTNDRKARDAISRQEREEQALRNRDFCCSSCDKCFRNKAALIAHQRNCKEGPIIYEKPNEPKISRKEKYQEALLRGDHYCQLCSRIFKSSAALIAHSKTCTGLEIYCDICGEQCESRKKLSKHISVAHNKMNHVCFVCGSAFKAKWLLEEHVARHSDPKPFKCDICTRSFSSKETLKIHIRATHLPTFLGFKCNLCEKIYPTNAKLARHMKTRHHSEGSFTCGSCNVKFGTEKALEQHIFNIHTPDVEKTLFKCTLCDHTAASQVRIEKHQMIHADPSQWPFGCEVCGKRFVQKHSLERHASIHTGEKPHSCEICGQTFRLAYQVKAHKLIHTPDVKPLQCAYCDKAYRDRASYNKHVKSHTVEEYVVPDHSIVLDVETPYDQAEN